jgi:RHS repeat-associated protein
VILSRLVRVAIAGFIVTAAPLLRAATVNEIAPRSAPRGARVIAAGSGLDGTGLEVTFANSEGGRTVAAVVTRTPALLEVRVPADAVTGEVRVVAGVTAIGASSFIVTAPPAAVRSSTLAVASKDHDSLKEPNGPFVALPNGIVYIADSAHHQVKAILPTGEVQLSAGTGNPGLIDGPPATAQFKSPQAVVIDRARNFLYIADTGNNVIRRLTLNGSVSTFAGSGRAEDRDGTGQQAGFNQPSGLTIDADGNLYVADTGNDKIKKITPAGTVTTFAGAGRSGSVNGLALQALFKKPQAVAVAADGALYIADTGNHAIRKIQNGNVTTFAGTGHPGSVDGSLTNAEFKEPASISFDESGELLIADTGNHQIRRISGGVVATIAGSGKPGLADGTDLSKVEYKQPSGIASEGAIYIADTMNDAIRVLYRSIIATDLYPRSGNPSGGEVVRIFGAGFVPGQTTVTFGGSLVQTTYVSSTELLVTTPAGALGTSTIAVSTPAGTATLRDAFTYVPPFVSIAIAPTGLSLDPNHAQQMTATGVLSGGGTSDLTTRVTWSSSDPNIATIGAAGLLQAVHPGSVTITATFETLSATLAVIVREPIHVPPDPAAVAPPLPPGGGASTGDSTSFLYSGSNPIQTGVAPGTIDPLRAGVIRGRVVNGSNAPLAGARVTIAGHPEYGSTLSRLDGSFDLAVNGGQPLLVRCEKAGFLSADRQIVATWQDFVSIGGEIRLIALDPNVTAIAAQAAEWQIARGSTVTDSSGTRRATAMFFPGTRATMEMSDGTTQPLTTLSVRATEYSVGNDGARAMPAPLPPQSAYTYCVELSIDEARDAGATSVRFSPGVPFYVENFLGFPVGMKVPVASYDRTKNAWIPSPDGKVIRIVAIESGAARVDTDGNGTPDDIGLNLAERQQLAQLYPAGTTLWRALLAHFTPQDLNCPTKIKDPDAAGLGGKPTYYAGAGCTWPQEAGSIIDCPSQILGEDVGLTGTPFALHYRSNRTAGRVAARTMNIPVTGADVPSSLLRVELEVSVAGQFIRQTFPAAPNQTYRFTWDGKDAYGREVNGARPVTIHMSYFYPAEYELPSFPDSAPTFGRASGIGAGVDARLEAAIVQTWTGQLGGWMAKGEKLGGWTLSPHHFYDVASKTLYRGDGSERTDRPEQFGAIDGVTVKIAGTSSGDTRPDWSGLGGPATSVKLESQIWGLAAAGDGSVYVASPRYIRRITPDGRMVAFAGSGADPSRTTVPPPQPANAAAISPESLTVAPDGTIYFVETFYGYVRHIEADGTVRVIAGRNNGSQGDGGLATFALMDDPKDVVAAPDGSVYICERAGQRIRRISPDGIITTVAGKYQNRSHSGDGGPAVSATLDNPLGIALGRDGSIYIIENAAIRRVGPDGIITTIAGDGTVGFSGDGGPAVDARIGPRLDNPSNLIAVAEDDSIIFADGKNNRIRRIDPNGIINTIVGSGVGVPSSITYNRLALATDLPTPAMVALASGRTMHFAQAFNNGQTVGRLDSILPALPPPTSEIEITDGNVIHVFDSEGRHLRTRHADTGADLIRFGYDTAGLLTTMTDFDGNVTHIERDSSGNATAVVAPGGQRTELGITSTGLTGITTAPGETVRMTYSPDGLMGTMRDARGNETTFRYDALGLLTRDADPEGGAKDIARVDTADGHVATVTTAEGRSRRYETEIAANGEETSRFVDSAGILTTKLRKKDGTSVTTFPDGTTMTAKDAPDPIFSMQSPFTASGTLLLPSGRTLAVSATRTATTQPSDATTVSSRTDRSTIGSRTYTRVFDHLSLTETITSPQSRMLTVQLDAGARPKHISVAALTPIDLNYNASGDLAAVTQGSRTMTYTYTPKHELETMRDSLGRITRFEYDMAGRVTKQVLPDLREIGFSYDLDGNLTSITPPQRPQHVFEYNKISLAKSYAPPAVPESGSTHYLYNKDRELTTIELPDRATIDIGYDAGGRIQSLVWPSGALTYGYLGTGNLGSITGADALLSYSYDGSLLTATTWSGAIAGTLAWTYSANLDLESETINGAPTNFAYDADGLLSDAGALHLTRNAAGIVETSALGAATDQLVIDGNAETTDYSAAYNGAQFLSFHYTRDAVGRITGITEHSIDGETFVGYAYDDAGRLQDAFYPAVNIHYVYDANGNRTARQLITSAGTVTESASYDAQDRLLNYEGTRYTYTANGELRTKSDASGTTTYDYDTLGNLRHVTLPNGTAIDYVIDGQNRRVGKKVNGTLVSGWLYGDQLRIVAELDGGGNVISRFVYGSRSTVPDYMIRNGVTYRIISDHLGSPRLVLNTATGAVVATMQYDEFGNMTSETNAGFIPFGFAGGLYERQTRLIRFGTRDYDAYVGRWSTKDDLGFAGFDTDLYAYANGDPINKIDSSGFSGMLAIHANGVHGSSDVPYTGHAWITFSKDGGDTHSYGTYGNNPGGNDNGLIVDWELTHLKKYGALGDASRTMWITDAQEARLMKLLEKYRTLGTRGWSRNRPCSAFAHDAWLAATGESLDDYHHGMTATTEQSLPQSLRESIEKANHGLAHRIVRMAPR